MSRKEQRRPLAGEECGRTYPGFRSDDGELRAVGGPARPNCGASSFAEVELAP